MRWVFPLFFLILLVSLGCGGGETTEAPKEGAVEAEKTTTGDETAEPQKEGEKKEPEKTEKSEEAGDDKKQDEGEKEPPVEEEERDTFKEKVIKEHKSFWADAQVGDWVLYVTHHRQLALWTVTEVKEEDGNKMVKFHKRWFYADGKEIPPTKDDKPYPDPIDVQTETEKKTWSYPFVSMKETEFVVPATGEKLKCLFTESARGERRSQNVYCRKVRCGGTIFTRFSQPDVTYVVLWDYGDKNKKPNLNIGIKKVTEHYMRYDIWWGEVAEGEEDPPGGEPPEPPEE